MQSAIDLMVKNQGNPQMRLVPSSVVQHINDKSGGLFAPGEQHDLSELWVWLIDRLHEDCAVSRPAPVHEDSLASLIATTMHKYQQGKYSAILECVQGSQIALVVCPKCSYKVTNVEPLTVLTLDVPEESEPPPALPLLLQRYFIKDTIEDWVCDKCKHRGGERASRLYHVPSCLAVVLKRFSMMPTGFMAKRTVPISIANFLHFHANAVLSKPRDAPPTTFELRAIGNHHGSYFGGHYTAVVKGNEEKWELADDDSVQTIENKDVSETSRTAYMLFFNRMS